MLVPQLFKELTNLVTPVRGGVYVVGGGYGLCNTIPSSVCDGVINGATTTRGGGVG